MDFPTVISLSESGFDIDAVIAQITLPTSGAAGIFVGMVRGETNRGNHHQTTHLKYEAYQPMAESKMRQVANEIRDKWPTIQGIAIIQRTGKLVPGMPSTLIACTSAHRNTGIFDAARYGIDRLKEIVPIWKKETGSQGEEWVEGEYHPKPGE